MRILKGKELSWRRGNSNQDILDEKNLIKKGNEVVWVSWDNPAMKEGTERGEAVSKWNKKLGGKDWGCGLAREHSPSVCVCVLGSIPSMSTVGWKGERYFPWLVGRPGLCFIFTFSSVILKTEPKATNVPGTCSTHHRWKCLLDSLHTCHLWLFPLSSMWNATGNEGYFAFIRNQTL